MPGLIFFCWMLMLPIACAGEEHWVGRFDGADTAVPAPWRLLQLDKRVAATQYRIRLWDGVPAIEATADSSMTLLARPVEVDLSLTPVLCWNWRVDAPLVNADMAKKSGDDYAARVYVAFKLPPSMIDFITRAKLGLARVIYGDAVPDAALNYVWDNRYPIGTYRPNAYTDRTRMIVVESGAAKAGSWVSERRDLLSDLKSGFAAEQGEVTLLAVASDTDNTAEKARAGFADLHFVSRDQPCASR